MKFRREYLEQAIADKQAELDRFELQKQQQLASAREPARVPAVEGASQSLAEAEQRLAEARQKELEAQNAYDTFLETEESEDDGLLEESREIGVIGGAEKAEIEGREDGIKETESAQEAGIWEIKRLYKIFIF